MRTFSRVRGTAALACACTLAAALTAFADNNPRTVKITVSDGAGAPLAGAKVVLGDTNGVITTNQNGIAEVALNGNKLNLQIGASLVQTVVAEGVNALDVVVDNNAAKATPAAAKKLGPQKHVPAAMSGLYATPGQTGGEIAGGIPVSCATGAYCQLPDFTSRQVGIGAFGTLAATSDRDPGFGFRVAENLQATGAGSVSTMCWWGIYRNFGLGADCAPGAAPDAFEVIVYNDDAGGGVPGTVKAGPLPVTVTAKFATGNSIIGIQAEYQFEGTFAPVAVADGECYWIEITNDAAGTGCAWLWDCSIPGDGRGAQLNGIYAATDYDLAICVDKAGTTCPLPLGACCIAGVCSSLSALDCAAAGGGYAGDGTDCGSVVCPTNDECANATSIACNSNTAVDNTTAGNNPADPFYSCIFGGPGPGTGTLWYSFVASDVSALVDTNGSAGFDSVIAVYDSCGGTELACDDDSGDGLLSRVCVTGLTVGSTYWIQFATFSDFDRGSYSLNLTCPCPPGPANDECAAAASIACGSSTALDNTDATNNPGDPLFSCAFGGAQAGDGTLWYSFVAADVSAVVDTFGSAGFDSLLAVYDACGGTELACNDDAGTGLLSRLCVTGLTVGNTYWIQFATFGTGNRGSYVVNLACPCPPAPANDECATPITIACNSDTALDNTEATTNVSDPLFNCRVGGATQGANSLWYAFVASDTSALISTDGITAFDSTIQVFDACGGAVVGCDDDGDEGFLSRLCVTGLTVGNTYIIEFASWSAGSIGAYNLNLTCPCPPPPAGDDCANAVAVAIPSSTPGNTSSAAPSAVPSCSPLGNAAPDQWFSVVGTGNTVTASLCDGQTTYDSAIEVYCGDCATGLTCVVGLDDFCGLQTEVSWCSQAGATYYIRIHGFAGGSGAFVLNMSDNGVSCTATVQCLPTGACCQTGDVCTITTEDACDALGGDYAGDGVPCATFVGGQTYSSGPIAVAIPDSGGGSVSVTTNVTDPNVIEPNEIQVGVLISHTWQGDLVATLTSPQGTTVTIIDQPGVPQTTFGHSADNYGNPATGAMFILADDAAQGPYDVPQVAAPGIANVSGKWLPDLGPLNAFVGENKGGTWTLTVTDFAGGDTGTILEFAIMKKGATIPTCPLCDGVRGDTNCSGGPPDFFDIDPFLQALFDLPTYLATNCGGSICAADIDCSGAVDFFDIDPFLACLFSSCPPCP